MSTELDRMKAIVLYRSLATANPEITKLLNESQFDVMSQDGMALVCSCYALAFRDAQNNFDACKQYAGTLESRVEALSFFLSARHENTTPFIN